MVAHQSIREPSSHDACFGGAEPSLVLLHVAPDIAPGETAEQVDQVMNRAVQDLRAISGVAATEEIVGTAAPCEAALVRLREAQKT